MKKGDLAYANDVVDRVSLSHTRYFSVLFIEFKNICLQV